MFDKLARELAGELRDDLFTLNAYSIDASIYRLAPQAVVTPRDTADIQATVAFAAEHGLTLTPRGAATGTTGGCLGPGIVLDLSRHMSRLLDLDVAGRKVVCQPGLVQDQLNRLLSAHGLRLGPDTSTGNRATLGGMLANNSCGAHSRHYGKMVDCVEAAELVLSDGSVLSCERRQPPSTTAAGERVMAVVARIRATLAAEIGTRYPQLQRRVSGYNLDELVQPDGAGLAGLVAGSEGTLGIVSAMTLRLVPTPRHTGLCVLHLDDLCDGLELVPRILDHDPFAVELIDEKLIGLGRASPVMRDQLAWLHGDPNGLLAIEFEAADSAQLDRRLAAFGRDLGSAVTRHISLTTPAEMAQVWQLRKAGLGLLMGRRTHQRAIAFMEDVAVPPQHLAAFMRAFRKRIQDAGKEAGFYGHAGVGCVHVRPMLDLRQEADVTAMVQMMEDVVQLAADHGGAISGEHGDGLLRSWLNERVFGARIYQAFVDLKHAFDPLGMMNPGKIVNGPPPTDNLKIRPGQSPKEISTFLDFSPEGGFGFAVEMCNGNAQCRQPGGTMCPSYQVSGDEYDTTRGRAQALAAVMRGDVDAAELRGHGLYDILDLCLECKGCKRECPSQVDMAKLKSEMLWQYQQQHGVPWRSRLFGAVALINRLGALAPGLGNWLLASGPHRAALAALGVTPERQLPRFAETTFSAWYRRQPAPAASNPSLKLVLFVDTFTEYNYPQIGRAAWRLLTALGAEIEPVWGLCCGRPQLSKGLLPAAQHRARKLVARLLPLVADGYRVIGLEPSCILTVRDEYDSLLPGDAARRVARACLTIDELLVEQLAAGRLPFPLAEQPAVVRVHGHCHQQAATGVAPTISVLQAVPGFEVAAIDSGCCGMAGSFGYETEHYEFSMQVGESRLFPALRELPADALIIADGVSCRAQIAHGTGRQAQHLVEVLAALTTVEGQ